MVGVDMRITGHTAVAGVIGHPVVHSLSPVIHNAGFASLGVDWVYIALDLAPNRAQDALTGMRALGIRGLSVTMPHKTDMARLVDEISPEAQRLKSVNTLALDDQDRITGYSTDGDGLVSSLQARGISLEGRSVVMFGAGGAARSVADALIRHGCSHLDIVNRTLESAEAACQLAPETSRALAAHDHNGVSAAMDRGDVIINATSVGMANLGVNPAINDLSSTPVDPALLRPNHVVVDLVYHPRQTALLHFASQAGCVAVDGLGMLIHQAALQQQIWTGKFPDVAAMTRAANEALDAAALATPANSAAADSPSPA